MPRDDYPGSFQHRQVALYLFDENAGYAGVRLMGQFVVFSSALEFTHEFERLKFLNIRRDVRHVSLKGANLRSSKDVGQFLIEYHDFCEQRGLVGPNHSTEVNLAYTWLKSDKTGRPLKLRSAAPAIYSFNDDSEGQEAFLVFCLEKFKIVTQKRGKTVLSMPLVKGCFLNKLLTQVLEDPSLRENCDVVGQPSNVEELSGCQFPSLILVLAFPDINDNSLEYFAYIVEAAMSRATLFLTVIVNRTPLQDRDGHPAFMRCWSALLEFFRSYETDV